MTPTLPQTVWLVRHGQCVGNAARDAAEAQGPHGIHIATRGIEVAQSGLGRRQSQSLGHWLGSLPLQGRPQVKADAQALARSVAVKHNAVVAFKGATTFIVAPEGPARCNVQARHVQQRRPDGDLPYFTPFRACHFFMNATSCFCALMMSRAILRSSGSLPYFSCTSAMSTAPSWCGIMCATKSLSALPL